MENLADIPAAEFGRFDDLDSRFGIKRSKAYELIAEGKIRSECVRRKKRAHWHSINRLAERARLPARAIELAARQMVSIRAMPPPKQNGSFLDPMVAGSEEVLLAAKMDEYLPLSTCRCPSRIFLLPTA